MKKVKPNQNGPFLKIDIEKNIESIFKNHYNYVCSAVYNMIPDQSLVEDIAQEVFYEFWKKRNKIQINTSLKAYLRRAAVNRTLNHIRKKKLNTISDDDVTLNKIETHHRGESMEYVELQTFINETIDCLPERCRLVFMMSRMENFSHKEISEELGISVKTVENQIGKALKILRKALAEHKAMEESILSSRLGPDIAC